MENEELKANLNPKLEKLGITDEVKKERIIRELDCLSNLIIDAYLKNYAQRKSTRSQ